MAEIEEEKFIESTKKEILDEKIEKLKKEFSENKSKKESLQTRFLTTLKESGILEAALENKFPVTEIKKRIKEKFTEGELKEFGINKLCDPTIKSFLIKHFPKDKVKHLSLSKRGGNKDKK